MKKCIVMHESDTVATALDALSANDEVQVLDALMQEVGMLQVKEAIPFGYKISTSAHDVGSYVYKYGEIIGKATEAFEAGFCVHIHNVESVYKLEG